LRLIEGVRITRIGLDLLDQSGNVAGKTVVLDGDRGLSQMVAVLDPLRDEFRLVGTVVERCGGRVQGRKRRRIEQRLNPGVTLGDIDDVAMDVVDRASDILSEVRSRPMRSLR
jgi:hypothetical protein